MLKNSLTLITLLVALLGQSQNIERLYADAMGKFYDEDLISARELFKEILNENSSYKDSQYRLEICELLTDKRNRSLDGMLAYKSSYGKSDKFYNYWLGRIYADKYEFRNAVRVWKAFLAKKVYKSKEIIAEVKEFIAKSEELIVMFDSPDEYAIHQLGSNINTEFDEITPVYFEDKDEVLFASSRDSEDPNRPTYFIYHSARQGNDWSEPGILRGLGRFEEDGANLEVIHADGKLIQFRPERGGDLYYSEATEEGWSIPQEFDNNITKAHIRSHFFINEHEDRIIFTSSQHFKREGLELYQSYKDPKSGKWTKPTLLSPSISSTWDEDTPYLSPDEKSIYFSSNRPEGLGGYDIYVSRLNEESNSWSDPVNMGFPINTPDDEMHFKMNFDQTSGYFSSSRLHSKGRFDVYFFRKIEKVDITGRIVDLSTGRSVEDVSISFRPSQYEDEYFRSDVDGTGSYRARIISEETFKVEIERNGQIIYTDEYEVHDTDGVATTYHQDFFIGESTEETEAEYAGPAETDATVEELGSKFRPGKTAVIRNIYFDHGTSQLKSSSTSALQALLKTMQKSNNLKIEVAGHTDNTGSKDVNQWLSTRRAEAIKNWLIKNGINTSRIVPKGYGETKPMASNDDEKDGRELNRRIEIIVIE